MRRHVLLLLLLLIACSEPGKRYVFFTTQVTDSSCVGAGGNLVDSCTHYVEFTYDSHEFRKATGSETTTTQYGRTTTYETTRDGIFPKSGDTITVEGIYDRGTNDLYVLNVWNATNISSRPLEYVKATVEVTDKKMPQGWQKNNDSFSKNYSRCGADIDCVKNTYRERQTLGFEYRGRLYTTEYQSRHICKSNPDWAIGKLIYDRPDGGSATFYEVPGPGEDVSIGDTIRIQGIYNTATQDLNVTFVSLGDAVYKPGLETIKFGHNDSLVSLRSDRVTPCSDDLSDKYNDSPATQSSLETGAVLNPPYDVDVRSSPATGDQDDPVTLVAFVDLGDPDFKEFYKTTFDRIRYKWGDDLRLVFRAVPTGDGRSEDAAIAAQCAFEHGSYWKYVDLLMNTSGITEAQQYINMSRRVGINATKFGQCLTKGDAAAEVERDLEAARSLKVDRVPTFFLNGEKIVGMQTYMMLNHAIRSELSENSSD